MEKRLSNCPKKIDSNINKTTIKKPRVAPQGKYLCLFFFDSKKPLSEDEKSSTILATYSRMVKELSVLNKTSEVINKRKIDIKKNTIKNRKQLINMPRKDSPSFPEIIFSLVIFLAFFIKNLVKYFLVKYIYEVILL